MEKSDHETDVHDLALGVIHALKMVDAKAMSYVQLRRLYASLVHTCNVVETEITARSGEQDLGKTVRLTAPQPAPPGKPDS
ncbi:MAG TPA: hypothetical protein PKK10_05020 [Woeseiaceae bacterium]|nr:hypothetical protein [Woeseiaceae bacterium]